MDVFTPPTRSALVYPATADTVPIPLLPPTGALPTVPARGWTLTPCGAVWAGGQRLGRIARDSQVPAETLAARLVEEHLRRGFGCDLVVATGDPYPMEGVFAPPPGGRLIEGVAVIDESATGAGETGEVQARADEHLVRRAEMKRAMRLFVSGPPDDVA